MSLESIGLVYSSSGIPTAKEGWLLGEGEANKESWLEEIVEERVRRERQVAYQEYVRKLAELNAKRLAELEAAKEKTRLISEYALTLHAQAEARIQEQAKAAERNAEIEQKFRRLADGWRRDTRYISSVSQIAMHPSYQKIVGMGQDVLPFILREMQERGGHWLWALHVITDEDPAPPGATFREAVQAWLEWGTEHGYLA
jgi:hypothetical protein